MFQLQPRQLKHVEKSGFQVDGGASSACPKVMGNSFVGKYAGEVALRRDLGLQDFV